MRVSGCLSSSKTPNLDRWTHGKKGRFGPAVPSVGKKPRSILRFTRPRCLRQLLLDLHNLLKSGLGGICLKPFEVTLQLGLGFVHGKRMQPSGLDLRGTCPRFGKLVALVRDGAPNRGNDAIETDGAQLGA